MKRIALIILSVLVLSVTSFSKTRTRSEHWIARNQQFDHELQTEPKGGVVFLGNSITEGFDLDKYFPGLPVINRGIVADHLDGILVRLENSAVGLKPQKLFLMIGINDIGDRREDVYLREMFSILVDTLTAALPETEIFVHSILPTTERWKNCPPEQIERINDFLEILALDKGIHYVDLHPLFCTPGTQQLNPSLTPDGLHLNDAGYAIWVKEINNYVE